MRPALSPPPAPPEPSRAVQLKSATRAAHAAVDAAVTPMFDDIAGYRRFAAIQYVFHRDLAPLYDDPCLRALLPDLAARERVSLLAADLADLGTALPGANPAPPFTTDTPPDVATALGWLYVGEGSRLGATLLRKAAARLGLSDSHGARHLAPAWNGPAAQWRSFVEALDAVSLHADEETRVVTGAQAAFSRVQALVDRER